MHPITGSRFIRLKAEIAEAGGFGDGIDTSAYDLESELGDPNYTMPERIEVSMALLVDLASAIDNSDWKSVQASTLARAAQNALAQGWIHEQPLAAAIRALNESEDNFFRALAEVFSAYV